VHAVGQAEQCRALGRLANTASLADCNAATIRLLSAGAGRPAGRGRTASLPWKCSGACPMNGEVVYEPR
jgi:hypothetical protein